MTVSPRNSARFLLGLWLLLVSSQAIAQNRPDLPYLVVDRASGLVLAENRAFDRWYPASLTKLMTLYVTLQAIRAGEIAAGSPVTMSAEAVRQPPSKMGWARGTQMRVDTAMTILIVKSANDVAVALAEAVAGTSEAFVQRMNEAAQTLGMRGSQFANANGLHSTKQYSTARDMAVLARALLAEFPDQAKLFATPAIRWKAGDGFKTDHSYNLLLERFPGADGMKTGFVCASGYNMVASATRNGRQLIAVLLGAFSQTERAVEAARVLLTGFERSDGPAIESHLNPGAPIPPESQRSSICSQQAMETRYDPGAGQARIDSPLLEPRRDLGLVLDVAPGGIDAQPSEAWLTAGLVPRGNVPVPERRPDYRRTDVDGEPVPGPSVPADWDIRGAVPIPTRRPQS